MNDVLRFVLPLAPPLPTVTVRERMPGCGAGLPRVMADRARVAEALTLLVREACRDVGPNRPLALASRRGVGVAVEIAFALNAASPLASIASADDPTLRADAGAQWRCRRPEGPEPRDA